MRDDPIEAATQRGETVHQQVAAAVRFSEQQKKLLKAAVQLAAADAKAQLSQFPLHHSEGVAVDFQVNSIPGNMMSSAQMEIEEARRFGVLDGGAAATEPAPEPEPIPPTDSTNRPLQPFVWFTSNPEGETRLFQGLAADIAHARRQIVVAVDAICRAPPSMRRDWVEMFVFLGGNAYPYDPSEARNGGFNPTEFPTLPGGEEVINTPFSMN